jgi:hypothetical protein
MIMKSIINFKTITMILPLAVGVMFLPGCQKQTDNSYEIYGKVDSLAASFTATPVQGDANKYVITNTTPGACVGTRWDLGKGDGWAMGKVSDTAFYPDAGTYTINMQALDKRGKLYSASPVTITITQSDPAYGNLIKGGKMNPGDDQYWSHYDANSSHIIWTLANGAFTATKPSSGDVNGGIYQAIQVVANRSYHFSMNTSYGAISNSWFQINFGKTVPADGKDYSDNQQISAIPWGNQPAFNGVLSCDVTFTTSGTIYVVIKLGESGGTLSSQGISVWNVQFRGN